MKLGMRHYSVFLISMYNNPIDFYFDKRGVRRLKDRGLCYASFQSIPILNTNQPESTEMTATTASHGE